MKQDSQGPSFLPPGFLRGASSMKCGTLGMISPAVVAREDCVVKQAARRFSSSSSSFSSSRQSGCLQCPAGQLLPVLSLRHSLFQSSAQPDRRQPPADGGEGGGRLFILWWWWWRRRAFMRSEEVRSTRCRVAPRSSHVDEKSHSFNFPPGSAGGSSPLSAVALPRFVVCLDGGAARHRMVLRSRLLRPREVPLPRRSGGLYHASSPARPVLRFLGQAICAMHRGRSCLNPAHPAQWPPHCLSCKCRSCRRPAASAHICKNSHPRIIPLGAVSKAPERFLGEISEQGHHF